MYLGRVKIMAATMAVCVLAACSACTSDNVPKVSAGSPMPPKSQTDPSAQTGPVRIPCGGGIGIDTPPTDEMFTIVDNAVALPSTNQPALQVVPVDKSSPASQDEPLADGKSYWAKQGIAVLGGHRVELSVAPEVADKIRIGWGHAPSTGSTSAVADCPSPEEWLGFPGGYSVREPGCYTIHARVDDKAKQQVDIGIGAPCPGQDPPPDI
jgi:hypothetical protein